MRNYIVLLPFLYFLRSRLTTLKAVLFHFYMEWLAAVLILLCFGGYDLVESLMLFLFGYTSFISIYEIGYIYNDYVSVKFENKPRNRSVNLNALTLGVAVLIRLASFALLTFYLGQSDNLSWWIGYLLLAISFSLHNCIRNTDYRLFTFFCLSLFRFFLPFYVFVSKDILDQLFASVLIGYVFFRSLIYMDSKGQLKPGLRSPTYNFLFYVLLVPAILFISQLKGSPVPIISYLYFLPLSFIQLAIEKLNN